MRKILVILFMLLGLSAFAVEKGVLPAEKGIVTNVEYVETENISGGQENQTKQEVTVKLLTGQFKGQEIILDNMLVVYQVRKIPHYQF